MFQNYQGNILNCG